MESTDNFYEAPHTLRGLGFIEKGFITMRKISLLSMLTLLLSLHAQNLLAESPSLFFEVIGPGCAEHVKDPSKPPLAIVTYDTGEQYIIPNYFGGSVFRELRLGFGSSATSKTFKNGTKSSTGIKLCEEKAKAFAKKNGYVF